MESQKHIPTLDLLLRPAFYVADGKITQINTAAAPFMLCPGQEIMPMLATGKTEYEAFQEGCLYLTINIGTKKLGANIIATDEGYLFILEHSNEYKELQSLSLAAKELRQPLTGMMAAAEQLFPASSADPSQIAQFNRRIYQMLRTVSNMSDAALYAQNDFSHMEHMDICSYLDELLSKTAMQLSQVQLQLQYQLPNQPIYTLADSDKLERAVYNLISNAAKHSPANGTIQVKLSCNGRLYLSVADQGIGIAPGIKSNIFDRYLRTPSITDGLEGIGLGMALVRCAATAHGGTVLIDHPQGWGTRVTMTMELKKGKHLPLRSPVLQMDYAGERDHGLLELSDILPASMYLPENID